MMTKCKSISTNNSFFYENESELRRGPWTLEEDNLLIHYITTHGEGRWNSLAQFSGLNRTGKSCRLRWLNYLKPDIKRGNLSPHEQLLILELHSRWGNRWSKIAQNLPGRTDNEIKNYWRTRVQKQARQLKIDSNSEKFLEAIRMYWMPRLIEKMEQDSSLTSPASSFVEIQNIEATIPLSNHAPFLSIPSHKPTKMVNNLDGNSSVTDTEVWGCNLTSHATQEYDKNVPCGDLIVENGYYNVDVPNYDMQEMVTQDVFGLSENHVAGYDWFGEETINLGWNNNEEFWQLRKP